MAVYAIGDVHGCLTALQKLLERIRFDPARDRLWFVGDLINRGPDSLGVVALVRGLGARAVTLMGNHEMRALALLSGAEQPQHRAYLSYVWERGDPEELRQWLVGLPVMHWEQPLGYAMVHAGVHPSWTLAMAWQRAGHLASFLASPDGLPAYVHRGPPPPSEPDTAQPGWRHWYHLMAFTSIRLCTRHGVVLWPGQAAAYGLEKSYLWPPGDSPFRPWFELWPRGQQGTVLYGHWAAAGLTVRPQTVGLDSGCVYGGRLTALRLDSEAPVEERLFQVSCEKYADTGD